MPSVSHQKSSVSNVSPLTTFSKTTHLTPDFYIFLCALFIPRRCVPLVASLKMWPVETIARVLTIFLLCGSGLGVPSVSTFPNSLPYFAFLLPFTVFLVMLVGAHRIPPLTEYCLEFITQNWSLYRHIGKVSIIFCLFIVSFECLETHLSLEGRARFWYC